MKRFLASAWFPFLTCLILAGVTLAAFRWILAPDASALRTATGGYINGDLIAAFHYAGWATGPAIGFLSLLIMGILNLIRRAVRLRKAGLGHLIVVLLGIAPWLIFSWTLTDEPHFTPFAVIAIEFVGRPMLWGSLAATLFALLLSIPLFFPSKK